jgi:hypothetical protein
MKEFDYKYNTEYSQIYSYFMFGGVNSINKQFYKKSGNYNYYRTFNTRSIGIHLYLYFKVK